MALAGSVPNCPKCDAVISKQSNGQTVTYDIAHQGERVRDALIKLQDLLDALRASPTGNLRVIVGHGLIKEEVNHTLATMLFRKDIIGFSQDGRNTGAFIVRLK
ncbi:MAG: broad specificity phosphatase PhoE [Flavobacterium sp.]|jgi:site-specific recombinase